MILHGDWLARRRTRSGWRGRGLLRCCPVAAGEGCMAEEPFELSTCGDALERMRGLSSGFAGELQEASKAMRGMDGEAQRLSRSLSGSLRSAFDKAVFGGARLGDVFRDLASSMAGKVLDASVQPVINALTGAFSGM